MWKLELKVQTHLAVLADCAPIQVSLDDLMPSVASTATRPDEPDTCLRRKRTSIGRKSKGECLEFEWPSDDSMSAQSTVHVGAGSRAFETINGSCWNTTAEYRTQSAADFAAVQETNILEDSVCDTEQAARNKGWGTVISPCFLSAVDDKSFGTSVCSRTHIGSRNSFADGRIDKAVQARFTMKHFGAVCKGGIHFGSSYLHCNWDQNRTFNVDLLQTIGALLATLTMKRVVA